MSGVAVTWGSSDALVATVDASGLVTAAGNGTATITATAGSASGSATATVAQEVETVAVSPPDIELGPGDTLRLTAQAADANGHQIADAVFAWSSSDTTVAQVDATGLVRAIAQGAATIIAAAGGAQGQSEVAVVSSADRAALIALHEAAGGPNWTRSDNWLSDLPLKDWHGVRVGAGGRVVALDLVYNNLTGSLPAEIGDLSALKVLSLSANALTGPLPGEVGKLSSLSDLDLNDNNLTSSLPSELFGLSGLKHLLLGGNSLSGPIPAELGQLSALEGLNLGYNRFAGQIPPELGQLSELKRLSIVVMDGVTGPIPPELGQLSNLVNLDLNNNSLTGSIPGELGNLSSLESMDLSGNLLSGGIPQEFGDLAALELLSLVLNKLTGPVPLELGQLSSLRILDAWGNELSGPLPAELGNLTALESLRFEMNQLSGSIPPEFGNLSSIDQLILSNNNLTGAIPAELGKLPRLRLLDLRGNDLTGEIPPELGAAPLLRRLDLRRNRLSGRIPPGLFDSPLLGSLLLGDNELSGSLPDEIGNLASLMVLDVANNSGMAGALPHTMTALEELGTLLARGTGLCAPAHPDFRAWLSGVAVRRIGECFLAAAYLTQAVQSRTFPVPLVADEAALLRVFPTAQRAGSAGIPPVRARFYLDGTEVHTDTIPGQSTPIPTEIDESSLDMSANLEIPGSVVQPGLEMVIEIDPHGTLDPGLGVPGRIPDTGRLAVEVRRVPTLDLTVIPFLWSENPDSTILDVTRGMTGADTLFRETRTLLPVTEMEVSDRDPVVSSTNEISEVLRQVEAIRTMEGGTGHYMGLMNRLGGAIGLATVGGRASVSVPDETVMAHELGHNMSLRHTPCGSPPSVDTYYPYPDGSIGAWGYDFNSGTLVEPGAHELMGYCYPRWISGYSFSRALRHRSTREAAAQAMVAAPVRSILLWGGAGADGAPFLEPAFVLDAPPATPTTPGAYTITGEDAEGEALFSLSFDMAPVSHGGESAFAFALPVRAGWSSLATLTLSGPGGSYTLEGESDDAMAILRDPQSGRVRAILRDLEPAALAQTTLAMPGIEPGVEAFVSRGIPGAAAWRP